MKKILIVALMALFAVSAYAQKVTVDFKGYAEFSGRYLDNADGLKEESMSNYYYKLRFWAIANIDDVAKITLRTTPGNDFVMGRSNTYATNFDRAYLTINYAGVTADFGKIQTQDYYGTMFGTLHESMGAGFVSSGEGLKLAYKIDDAMKVYALVVKKSETQFGSAGKPHYLGSGQKDDDETQYIFGADLAFGDIRIVPTFGYLNDERPRNAPAPANARQFRYTTNVAALYNTSDISAAVTYAAEYIDQDGRDNTKYAYGIAADVTYKMDGLRVGAVAAYGSEQKDHAFEFGDSHGKNWLIEDVIFPDRGAKGMVAFEGYADYTVMTDLVVSGVLSYYTPTRNAVTASNVSGNHSFAKYANMFETDLGASYALSKSTQVYAKAAYLMFNDTTVANKHVDDMFAMKWGVITKF